MGELLRQEKFLLAKCGWRGQGSRPQRKPHNSDVQVSWMGGTVMPEDYLERREQLMEDIGTIVEGFGYFDSQLVDRLCDAVVKNFPSVSENQIQK